MADFGFEVRESDLLGRIGVIRTGTRTLETPAFLPVVHPVSTEIPPREIEAIGYRGLMTNSLIMSRRLKEESLAKGVHGLLGFPGLIMTDSGGYQVLEYGGVKESPLQVANFQESVGSDLAVTLDMPTGLSYSRDYAERTVRVSLRNAKETIGEVRSSQTTLVGPVQGGVFPDLVSKSARGLLKAGFEVLALGSPVELMENYMFSRLVEMIAAARRAIPFGVPLHLFGAGHPMLIPLIVALGCDTFDSASYALYAKQGRYMTERGTTDVQELEFLPCGCPVCSSTTAEELKTMERAERVRNVSRHNLHILLEEIRRCKQAIAEGRLWDLVEERAASHPSLKAAFVELTRHAGLLEAGTRLIKDRGLMVRSEEDLFRPEVALAKRRVSQAMRRGRAVRSAVVVKSGESRVMSRLAVTSLLKKIAGRRSDVYRLHPVLGLFPAELEFVNPFTQVVGDGRSPGARVQAAVTVLRGMGYAELILCDGRRVLRRLGLPHE